MIHLYGPHLCTEADNPDLLSMLPQDFPAIHAFQVRRVFLIDAIGELSAEHCGLLTQLLPIDDAPDADVVQWVVLPDLKKVSPWSLKTTKLAHDCGLTAVRRIERGRVYTFSLDHAEKLDSARLKKQIQSIDADVLFEGIPAAMLYMQQIMAASVAGQQQLARTILSRRQPMLHASWQTTEGEKKPAWFELFSLPLNQQVKQRCADYAVVLSGVEAPFRQIDSETGVYTLRQEQRQITFQLASRCRSDYGCSLLGEVAQGNSIKAALLGVLTHQQPDPAELQKIKHRSKLNNARGIPTLCGFWQPGLSVKTRMISGEYGYIRPEHMTVGGSTEWVYFLIDQVETFRSAQTIVERCIELAEANPICEIRLSQCQQPVFCVDRDKLSRFTEIMQREGCQYQMLTDFDHVEPMTEPLVLHPIEKMARLVSQSGMTLPIADLAKQVLSAPAVADKSFLIRHLDHSVGGLVARDAMVGLWQVPISNVSATCHSFQGFAGEAIAMGERLCQGQTDLAASARMAVAEAMTNLLSADVGQIDHIVLNVSLISAKKPSAEFYRASEALVTFCQTLGIELGMTHHVELAEAHAEGFVVTALSRLADARQIVQPRLRQHIGFSHLLLIDLGLGQHRLAGSILSQVVDTQLDSASPDITAQTLKSFIQVMLVLHQSGQVQAYHDRSDGGLLVTLSELVFAARVGMTISLDTLDQAYLSALFCEEAGVVLQVQEDDLDEVLSVIEAHGLPVHVLGELREDQRLVISHDDTIIFDCDRASLQQDWARYGVQLSKDQPWQPLVEQEYALIAKPENAGLTVSLTFDVEQNIAAPYIGKGYLPRVAVLRQQDGFGQTEMAAAFELAGFECVDVHMNDLKSGQLDLADFKGLAINGAFSYGDVLGAGVGWAKTILLNPKLVDCFRQFFEHPETFTLAIGNGAQLLTHLRELIPGSSAWPHFYGNQSGRFEARLSMVEVAASRCIFTAGMSGSQLPIVVSHASGRADFSLADSAGHLLSQQQSVLHYIDQSGQSTECYPFNPDGSVQGIAAFCSVDGRVLAMMPHVERAFRTIQFSWHPHEWGEFSPWMQVFRNARVWVD